MASINPNLRRQKKTRPEKTLGQYVEAIRAGDRVALSQAITLVESRNPAHQAKAQAIIEQCLPFSGESQRIGISGSPGVGKSTFIEAIGQHITSLGQQVAILAIDPSSQMSKGSILGDKTRMQELSTNPAAFVRPSPAGETLGGVARKTRETIILCEAAGFELVLIETVGVGQSEIAVHSMVDCFLLLLLPGAGDELQGIKRGIVEMADIVCINKADSDRMTLAKHTKQAYRNALHLFPAKESDWTAQVRLCSALARTGITEIWETIGTYFETIQANNYFQEHRQQQATYWLRETIDTELRNWFYQHSDVQNQFAAIEKAVLSDQLSSFQAAEHLLKLAFRKD